MRNVLTARSQCARIDVAACAALLLVAGATAPIRAQQASVHTGSVVRFATDSARGAQVFGQVIGIMQDSIAIQRDTWLSGQRAQLTDSVRIPLSAIHRLETRTSEHRHTLAGLGIGALAGGLFGGIVMGGAVKSAGSDCKEGGTIGGCAVAVSGAGLVAATALSGAALGGLFGAMIGAVVVTEEWMPANVKSTARLELSPHPGGFSVGVNYSVR